MLWPLLRFYGIINDLKKFPGKGICARQDTLIVRNICALLYDYDPPKGDKVLNPVYFVATQQVYYLGWFAKKYRLKRWSRKRLLTTTKEKRLVPDQKGEAFPERKSYLVRKFSS